VRWLVQPACPVEMRNAYIILDGKHEGNRTFGRSRGRWRAILKRVLQKMCVITFSRLRKGTSIGSCQRDIDTRVSMKRGDLFQ
jgi:hypothetical protein